MKIVDINGNERECVSVSVDEKWPGQVSVVFESKNRQGYTHTEWYPLDEFIKNNLSLRNLVTDAVRPVEEDLGVVTSGGTVFIKDKHKKWGKNVFTGVPVWISRGKGEGQLRSVVENSANTLFVDKKWDVVPDASSQYVISYNVHDPQVRGNTLPGGNGVVKKSKSEGIVN